MAYFLLFLTCFQFLFMVIGLQQTPIYLVINPYVILAPFFIIWLAALGFYRQTSDKSLMFFWLIFAALQVVVATAFVRSGTFPFDFVRSIQYFWGPALLAPMLLGLFRIASTPEKASVTTQRYIYLLCIIASSITLIELFAVWVLKIPPLTLPWVTKVYGTMHRPFGLPAYPQPNAVLLALLFWLSYLHKVPGTGHRFLTFFALCLTFGATGDITFLALIPLWTKRPVLFSGFGVLLLVAVMGAASATSQYATNGPFSKLDFAYLQFLVDFFFRVLPLYMSRFTPNNYLLGSSTVTGKGAIGLTHDWAYFDVFYVYGILGVAVYLLLYGAAIYLACPRERSISMRAYFTAIALIANFHYGTLNYYVGQFLFSSLAALGLYRSYFARGGGDRLVVNGNGPDSDF
ncbi:MAG: hypothetical protein KGJ79_11200 [Alphaproteobacteria bacterium]|nr:hypothetical protein [Alphaproteobacteria bacterium]MDE2493462.1 hypothetical protein [Alphaproteobacteria bacterium]